MLRNPTRINSPQTEKTRKGLLVCPFMNPKSEVPLKMSLMNLVSVQPEESGEGEWGQRLTIRPGMYSGTETRFVDQS